VGNLVCPSGWDLGEHLRVVISSVPEGHDKPIKYPGIFVKADALLLNKTDLAPYLDFDAEAFRTAIRAVNADAPLFELSCKTGQGIAAWLEWLTQ
jgi:hydrogenase nickel incorporation protein HypB